nr:MarR family winged helix-turn-helix transcriptional regulator [Microbacterium bovistercoris]
MAPTSDSSADPAELIAAALARLRGPRPPRRGPEQGDLEDESGDHPHHGHGPGGPFRGGEGGRHGRHAGPHSGHGMGFDPHMHGGPPWASPRGRFAGPARLRLLEALAAASTPLSVGEIAERIGVDQPRASRLVQQSVQFGLVRREADPDDARRTRIVITDQGTAILRGFRGYRRAAVEDALADFTPEERAQLAALLTKLADSWPR